MSLLISYLMQLQFTLYIIESLLDNRNTRRIFQSRFRNELKWNKMNVFVPKRVINAIKPLSTFIVLLFIFFMNFEGDK